MIKLHATRLMRAGEVVIWRDGAMVWSGAVGAYATNVVFDTVSMYVGVARLWRNRIRQHAEPAPQVHAECLGRLGLPRTVDCSARRPRLRGGGGFLVFRTSAKELRARHRSVNSGCLIGSLWSSWIAG